MKISTFLCPSESNTQAREWNDITPPYKLYNINYVFNMGTWLIWNPSTRQGGNGLFYPNSCLNFAAAVDGTSNTLLCAEVKAWTPYSRANTASDFDVNTIPDVATVETLMATASDKKAGPALTECTGHSEWPDGRCHHNGFTTVFAPNTKVKYGNYDRCDMSTMREGRDSNETGARIPTCAALTSRSYHAGIVNVSLLDGSVKTISDTIDVSVWRAQSTRSGGE